MSEAKINTDIKQATQVIKDGRIVAFPSGTSYGLACDTQQGFALQRLRNIKKRPAYKSFSIFLADDIWDEYLEITDSEQKILKAMSMQDLSLLVKPKEKLAHMAQEGLVAIRVIDHPLMKELADATKTPLTATSANISGEESCFTPQCVQTTFPHLLSTNDRQIAPAKDTTYDLSLGLILDGGKLSRDYPSTIAKVVGKKVELIRQGGVTATDLEKAIK